MSDRQVPSAAAAAAGGHWHWQLGSSDSDGIGLKLGRFGGSKLALLVTSRPATRVGHCGRPVSATLVPRVTLRLPLCSLAGCGRLLKGWPLCSGTGTGSPAMETAGVRHAQHDNDKAGSLGPLRDPLSLANARAQRRGIEEATNNEGPLQVVQGLSFSTCGGLRPKEISDWVPEREHTSQNGKWKLLDVR